MDYELIYTTDEELCGKVEILEEKLTAYTCDDQTKNDMIQIQDLLKNL